MNLLGWTPLIDPMPGIQSKWLWLLPILVLGIAMMYKAIRVADLARWPREVSTQTIQVLGAILGLAIGLYLLVQIVVPVLPAN